MLALGACTVPDSTPNEPNGVTEAPNAPMSSVLEQTIDEARPAGLDVALPIRRLVRIGDLLGDARQGTDGPHARLRDNSLLCARPGRRGRTASERRDPPRPVS